MGSPKSALKFFRTSDSTVDQVGGWGGGGGGGGGSLNVAKCLLSPRGFIISASNFNML